MPVPDPRSPLVRNPARADPAQLAQIQVDRKAKEVLVERPIRKPISSLTVLEALLAAAKPIEKEEDPLDGKSLWAHWVVR